MKRFPDQPRSSRSALPTRRGALTLRPWRAGDEEAFEPRADFAEEARLNAWCWAKGPPGPTWTLMQGDQVLGIGGVFAGEAGAWLAWASLSALPARLWPEAIRLAGVVVDHAFAVLGARWIWAQCRADLPAAERALHRLAFRLHHLEHAPALGVDIRCMLREG